LGVQSVAVGAAARLSNGNYWFCAGFILPHDTQSSEVTPAGDLVFRSGVDAIVYRTFRLRSMYAE
jgi:Na+-translocating ferredoxin:NAD+ oxidoreductase RnfD subunit